MGSVIERKFDAIVKDLKQYSPPVNEDDWQAMERLLNARAKTYSGKDQSILISVLIGLLLLIVAFFIFKNALFSPKLENTTVTEDTARQGVSSTRFDSALYHRVDTATKITELTDTLVKDTLAEELEKLAETQAKAPEKKPKKRRNQSKKDSINSNTSNPENKTGEEYDFTKDQQGKSSTSTPAADSQNDDSNKTKKRRRSFFRKKASDDTENNPEP